MTSGYVMFRLDDHTFATPLETVREIIRLAGVEPLPGTTPPMAGVLVLRGLPLGPNPGREADRLLVVCFGRLRDLPGSRPCPCGVFAAPGA